MRFRVGPAASGFGVKLTVGLEQSQYSAFALALQGAEVAGAGPVKTSRLISRNNDTHTHTSKINVLSTASQFEPY